MKQTILAGLLACSSWLAYADATTDQARALIEQGKGRDAYALLEPLEAQRAGEVPYDLLLGISAIESGQGTRAIFALERVLAIEPNNARARAEIARAYLLVGENNTAKTEFENAKKQGVPPEVAATIDKLIIAIDRMNEAGKTVLKGYVEFTAGYDSNVNAAPNRSTVAIPGLGGLPFELSENSRAQRDSFGSFGGGLSFRHPFSKEVAVVAGVSGVQRWNSEQTRFNTGSLDAYAGVVLNFERNVFSLTGQHATMSLAGHEFRVATGVTALLQHNLDARNQLSIYAQQSNLQYTSQPVRDANRWVLGGAYAHVFREGPTVFASLYQAKEDPQKANVDYLGHRAYGLRFGGQWGFDAKTTLFGSLVFEQRNYDAVDPAFLVKRADNQYGLNVGATYMVTRDFSVTPQINLSRNQSSVDLNDYHREMISVTLKQEF